MNSGTDTTARGAVVATLTRDVARFPDLAPEALELDGLRPDDAALANAIHLTALRHWLTLEHLLNRRSKRRLRQMQPPLQAVLLTGAAQLVYFERLPAYAVIDESVKLARRIGQGRASGLINAMLRKLDDMLGPFESEPTWTPAPDRLPYHAGCRVLPCSVLPSTDNMARHLEVATSHPLPLVLRWIKRWGHDQTRALCAHDLLQAPTYLHDATGCEPWTRSHAELLEHLAQDPRRRVQDPAAALAVTSTVDLSPRRILDYCAGKGTKTRQLADVHPGATVLAMEVDPARRELLMQAVGRTPTIRVVSAEQAVASRVDLLVLDVPCSNTGVLARRPQARYRFSDRSLGTLVELQRQIITRAIPTVEPGGHVLYTTCSLVEEENQHQAGWLIEHFGGQIVAEQVCLPSSPGDAYHDGSYHVLIRLP